MPRGFAGPPAISYLTKANDASREATRAGSNLPVHAPPGPRKRNMPFPPDDADFGRGFSSGVGNSSNIVADMHEYNAICNAISRTDDQISDVLYRMTVEIETMCQTIFKLPRAIPRCLNISSSVKNMLGDFREVTDEATMEARGFVRALMEIGL